MSGPTKSGRCMYPNAEPWNALVPDLVMRVDQAAGEAALPDIERRHQDLELLDGLERNRLGTGAATRRAARGQTEDVVVGPAVDQDRVEPAVLPADRSAEGDLRAGPDQVGEVAAEKRIALNRRVGHDLRRAGPPAVDQAGWWRPRP